MQGATADNPPSTSSPESSGGSSIATTWYALTVDTAADTVAVDGKCSLREAVAIVNRVFDPNNDCALGTSATPWDTIQFDPALAGPITLTSNTPLALNTTAFVSLAGPSPSPAAAVVVDGNNATRILDIATGANVTLRNFVFQHGKTVGSSPDSDGGAIRNAGVLSLTSCILHLNTSGGGGGAIDNEGVLTIEASTFSNNTAASGGALIDRNTLSIAHGYIANNNAVGQGGALDLRGHNATLTYTTVQNNTAGSFAGGGIFVSTDGTLNLSGSLVAGNHVTGIGAGIGNFGALTVSNSTFYGNVASSVGGAISNEPDASMTSHILASTFGANSGAGGNAVANLQGAITLRHSLLAGVGNCTGTITDTGGNIAGDATCGLGATSLSNTDPQLQPLASYGGPTLTMPPAATSPAIDVLNAGDCDGAIDATGTPRPQGGKCDIGAVELPTDRIFPDGFDLWP
ncbi:MAG TPA: right-handed parallel beta-helix repeat-containing protein [Rudaea sp.]